MRLQVPKLSDARDHIITGLILLLSIGMMVSRHRGGLDTLRTASITVLSYLEEPLSSIRIYRKALKTNADLRRQNVLLLDELSRYRSAAQQNEKLRELLNFQKNYELPLQPVQVVGKELIGLHNSLTINAGTKSGVKQGMPMITENGLVGKVLFATKNYAQVMPFANRLFRVSAQIQNSRAYGIISWSGHKSDELLLEYIPQTISASPGQIVETSGYSNEFPPNIPVGEIIRVEEQQGRSTQLIYVSPDVNLHTIAEGLVVQFEPDSAITKLSKKFNNTFE